MIKGLYQAAAGMKAQLAAQEIIANNLANAATAGFEREIVSIQSRRLSMLGAGAGGTQTPFRSGGQAAIDLLESFSVPDIRAGALEHTAAEGDVALDGSGYLVVRTGQGPRLIRGGSFRANPRGELATVAGDAVLGTDGKPIRVADQPWRVAPDGTVSAGSGTLGRLRVVRPVGPIRHEGAALLSAGRLQDAPAGTVRVLQGFLEHSNVESVREMVDMIAGVRAYESAQRAVLAQDQTLQSLFEVLRQV